jgi:secondary thiamine-phosphate synthase enzyme
MIETRSIKVSSGQGIDIIDITEKVQKEIEKSKINEGFVNIFVKGSTASVSTMEFEPNLKKDIEEALNRLAPPGDYHHHKTWGDHNGHSHIRATLLGPSCTIPFKDSQLILGQWQQCVLLDFDVPARDRELILTVTGE